MAWKGVKPVFKLRKKTYEKGISLSWKAMREAEAQPERNPLLPKRSSLIRPA